MILIYTTTWSLAWLNNLHYLNKKCKPFLVTILSSSTPNPQNLLCTRASAHCNIPLKPEVQKFWKSIQVLKSFCTTSGLRSVSLYYQMLGLESTLFFSGWWTDFFFNILEETLHSNQSRCEEMWHSQHHIIQTLTEVELFLNEKVLTNRTNYNGEIPETTIYQDRMRS